MDAAERHLFLIKHYSGLVRRIVREELAPGWKESSRHAATTVTAMVTATGTAAATRAWAWMGHQAGEEGRAGRAARWSGHDGQGMLV